MTTTRSTNSLKELGYRYRIEKAKLLSAEYVPWQPDPRNLPQCEAFALADKVDELGYGGQAGGGKTDLVLGLAGTKFERSLILRSEFPQLEGIIDRGNELFPAPFVAGYKRRWKFGRRQITLGSLQLERSWKKYQGRARDFVAVDEASEVNSKALRMVTGWVRAAVGKKTFVLYCFNPPTTPEGEWIIEYFKPWLDPTYPNPAEPGEIRYFAELDDKQTEVESAAPFEHKGVTVYPISRTFIPASRHDNQYLGEEYERRLQNLPEPYRTMFMTGDMTIRAQDDEAQVIPTAWVLEAERRWLEREKPDVALRALGVDIARGGTDRTALAKLYGTYFDSIITISGKQTDTGEKAADVILKHHEGEAGIYIDAIGYGASAYDATKKTLPSKLVHAVVSSRGSKHKDKSGKFQFLNLRAEMWWRLREALDPESGEDICLPKDRELRSELLSARYRVTAGKIIVEEKKDIKKRLGRSPDKADAVVYSWYGTYAGATRTEGVWW